MSPYWDPGDPRRCARAVQIRIFKRRHALWRIPPDPLAMCDPLIAIEKLHGFSVEEVYEIPVRGMVAGVLDWQDRTIQAATYFGPNVYRFTLAHELGHLEMHSEGVRYRDPPLRCSQEQRRNQRPTARHDNRYREEREAQIFAAEFLMPERLLKERFRQHFGVDRFDDSSALEEVAKRLRLKASDRVRASDLHGLDRRKIANFVARSLPLDPRKDPRSLADIFGVSPQAMTIQLVDRGLVDLKPRAPIANPCCDVFVSYDTQDLQIVKNIANDLARKGIRPWLASGNVTPGEPWQKRIQSVIESVSCAVFCIGTRGVKGWQEIELQELNAQRADRDLRLIPVILPGTVGEPEMPLFLKLAQAVDFREQDPDPLHQLTRAISQNR